MAYKRKYSSRRKSYRKSRRGKYGRKRGARSFQSRVKKAVLKTAETKFYDIADENVQLYHDRGTASGGTSSLTLLFNPWADIIKGTGRSDRVGDKITPRGMALKIWLANKSDRPNVMYRIMVVRMPKAVTGTVVTAANTTPFETTTPLGATGNAMILPLDKDRGVRALYDKVINLQTGFSAISAGQGKECHRYLKLWIRSKNPRDIIYENGGATIVNNPLLVYVIPYDSYGTLVTDNIASLSYYARLYYKDI